MDVTTDAALRTIVHAAAHPIDELVPNYDRLFRLIGDARFILLGEASHGTHEFYAERARITKRLIEEAGVLAVAAEADWPDAARVNRYVRGAGADRDAESALHLDRPAGRAKVAVWAHNSHLGDARATEMARRGELNVGQLVRDNHGNEAVLIGFTTHHGTVTAASDWDGPAERKRVRPALHGSFENAFHATELPRFLLTWREGDAVERRLAAGRLERAIGVIYHPDTERGSHYFHARIAHQFDAVLHFDETRAVEPLERTAGWEAGEVPETYPFAV